MMQRCGLWVDVCDDVPGDAGDDVPGDAGDDVPAAWDWGTVLTRPADDENVEVEDANDCA